MAKHCRDCGVRDNGANFYEGRPRCKPCHNIAMGEYARRRKAGYLMTSHPLTVGRALDSLARLTNTSTVSDLFSVLEHLDVA